MDNRRVAGPTGILALSAVMLLVVWGCPQKQAPDNATSTPPVEPPVLERADKENQDLLDDFAMLESIAGTGQVILRISSQGPGKEETPACTRKIKVQTFGPTIYWKEDFTPREVTWQVAQSPPGSWMEGDRIFVERKLQGADPCFSAEPFDIHYPDLDVESDQPLPTCKIDSPLSVVWQYKATLFNEECESADNPKGEVASWDPVVIIRPRP